MKFLSNKTGLILLGTGAGIQVLDYLTAASATSGVSIAGAPAGTTSPGGIFYGPGGLLANYPRTGLILIILGGIIWVSHRG